MTDVEYKVRVSARARHPRLKMSVREGLVVVIPDHLDRSKIPTLLEGKRDWIRRSELRLREQRKFLLPEPPRTRPERIALTAVGQDWSVTYRLTERPTVAARERSGQQLLVYGCTDNEALVVDALERWLSRKTREHLAPWLRSLGHMHGLDVSQVAIRSQRTRWASCSRQGTISLNLRLVFLSPELVRYALLHELAHLREPNHGKRFWTLMAALEPDYRGLDQQLRTGWRLVPDWVRSNHGTARGKASLRRDADDARR